MLKQKKTNKGYQKGISKTTEKQKTKKGYKMKDPQKNEESGRLKNSYGTSKKKDTMIFKHSFRFKKTLFVEKLPLLKNCLC